MRNLLLASLVALSTTGCNGVEPELYALVLPFFTLPDNCYLNNAQPSNVTVQDSPSLLNVQVWDGPEQTAILEIESGLRTIDMGDAPNITLTGLLTGKRGTGGWTFTHQGSDKSTQVGRTITDDTKVEFTFERGQSFKGTAALSSTRSCAGSTCMGTQPSCNVSGINITGTRFAVKYERGP
ncbi:MAG: hypothetical protein JNJ54_35465 [Myxococcaceae bacterium]|nr:hypothetical protein [Myxococcaceae bacterium]